MLVLHERKSRLTLAAKLAGKTAAETISVMLAVFARIEPALRKSITFDNDTAFAQHALLRTMRAMTTWFCDAYASWQKGGVENANGRLRRWLPRQIDIDQVSDEEIQDIVITANLTPRKCLGFKTPFQAILKELGKDVQIRFSYPVALGCNQGALPACYSTDVAEPPAPSARALSVSWFEELLRVLFLIICRNRSLRVLLG